MAGHSRREVIRAGLGVAAGATLARGAAAAAAESGYLRAVAAEPSLLALWPFDGDVRGTRGALPGQARGGDPVYVPGPAGGRAVALAGGRFLDMGAAPALDTDAGTVELFFQVTAAPTAPYNPCLVARRSSSQETRFSVHYMRDLASLAVWNGQAVATFRPPEGPLVVGRWYHLAVSSGPRGLAAWVDGVACDVSGSAPFTGSRKGLPLVVGASDPGGAEAADCAVACLAVYGTALPAAAIARHVDAVGAAWREKRTRMAREQERLKDEQRRTRARKLAQRLKDPRLTARGETRVYRDEHLGAISFPLGGLGGGCLLMNGKGERAGWQVFNNFAAAVVPDSYLAVRVVRPGKAPVVRALQTAKAGPFAPMRSLSFRGEYPFAWYDFEDPDLPVAVSMRCWSPFIPLNEKDSALPCAVFDVTLRNPAAGPVRVELTAVQQNAVGFTGEGTILANRHAAYGGNRNAAVRGDGLTMLHMTADRDPKAPGSGDMALLTTEPSAVCYPGFAARSVGANVEMAPSAVPEEGAGAQSAGPSPAGATITGAVAVELDVAAHAEHTATFALVWHFPNAKHGGEIAGWEHTGNQYANWWASAREAGDYLAQNLDRLRRETLLYHDTLYASNLPHWLLDRVSSQAAILRTKTCFWAGDGYFGAWEGCAPGSGCCAGNCTHVWHYAQAHARLFPAIARLMRQETYRYQKEDGSLPHRHPSLPPAADGQCGDILGVWREHLCSPDGAWLKQMWPAAQKAMEATIKHWDPDEDGVLAGAQWNTLDGELGGSTSWIGTLYLSALAACERMASVQGDTEYAWRCRRIRQSGERKQDATLFNGEYYAQIPDATPRQDYGQGCHIDQLLGEWWGEQVDLPRHYPAEHVRSALAALVQHNFRPDMHGVPQAPRKFVDDGDACTQMIQWPEGRPRPNPCMQYADEAMTGFEYAAAGAMIQQGMLREGLMLALAVSDRYDGRLRTGLTPGGFASWGYSGNPFGDDECGKNYARAMSSWSLLLACQGFVYDGPTGTIGFRPVWRPNDHTSFFTGAEGWGLFTQQKSGSRLRARIEVAYGRLRVREVVLPWGEAPGVTITLSGKPVPAGASKREGEPDLRVSLQEEAVVLPGQTLEIVSV